MQSSGELALTQLSVPSLWPLLRASFGLAVEPPAATLTAKARYAGSTARDAAALALDGVELALADVALRPSGSEAALLRLQTLAVHAGRLDLAARKLAAAEVVLSGGALALDRNREGRLDWQALGKPPRQGEPQRPEPTRAAKAPPWQARIDVIRGDAKTQASATAQASPRPPFEVAIEQIRIRQGVLDYADLSLVLPFSTQVVKLDGTVLGVTTERSSTPA